MEDSTTIYMDFIDANNLKSEKFEKGSYLFRQGDPIKAAFYLYKGSVFILRDNLVLCSASEKELIGTSSYMSSSPNYCFSARINSDSLVYRIPVDLLDHALLNNHELTQSIMKELCRRIERIDYKTRTFMEKPSRNRLIEIIVEQSRLSGKMCIPYHISELSELVGVSARLIRSMIYELEDKKLVRYLKGKLEVLDLKGLELISRAN